MSSLRLTAAPALLLGFGLSCLPGGVVERGGHLFAPSILPAATRTGNAPYRILCRETDAPLEESEVRAKAVTPAEYRGGCEEEGESSTFFLFNALPVTDPLDPEYAIASAVRRLEGDTMINITLWHETHYYSLLGRALVVKARGEVIRFTDGVSKE